MRIVFDNYCKTKDQQSLGTERRALYMRTYCLASVRYLCTSSLWHSSVARPMTIDIGCTHFLNTPTQFLPISHLILVLPLSLHTSCNGVEPSYSLTSSFNSTNPSCLLNLSNCILASGLVNPSATISSVGIYVTEIFRSSSRFRI